MIDEPVEPWRVFDDQFVESSRVTPLGARDQFLVVVEGSIQVGGHVSVIHLTGAGKSGKRFPRKFWIFRKPLISLHNGLDAIQSVVP